MSHPYGSHWQRRLRPFILERDGRRCQIGDPGCTVYATTVDHIVPRALGGSNHDPANLRAACAACNYGRGASLGGQRAAWAHRRARGARKVYPGAIE